jgi:hypothetical protein
MQAYHRGARQAERIPRPRTVAAAGGRTTIQRRTDALSEPDVLQLHRMAGNAAVARLLQAGRVPAPTSSNTGPRMLQRQVTYGLDPVDEIANADKDLLYGLTGPRGQTKGRMLPAQKVQFRTIDEYNRDIGINAAMNQAALGLFDIRAELDSANPWALAGATMAGADSAAWIAYLRNHADWIGLKDLGVSAGWFGTDKIKKKDRFTKNRKEPQTTLPKSQRLTAGDVRRFLASNSKASATVRYNAMSAANQTALNDWVYRAFFRRTSKLGQMFALNVLDAKIHFNTRADPDYDPILRVSPVGGRGMMDYGIEAMSAGAVDQNRSITVSEYRHILKLMNVNPGRVNIYGE